MTPHADQDRCLPLAAGSFCTMKSFCGKKKIYKISFEIGILNFQHISIKGIWELFFLPIEILSALGVQDATFCTFFPSPWSLSIGPFCSLECLLLHASKVTSLSYLHFLGDFIRIHRSKHHLCWCVPILYPWLYSRPVYPTAFLTITSNCPPSSHTFTTSNTDRLSHLQTWVISVD